MAVSILKTISKNPMKRMVAAVLTVSMLSHAGGASALSLLQAYEAALQNDPVYRAAMHERDAGRQNAALGRASLMPALSMSYSLSKNRADVTSLNILGQSNTTHPEYTSESGVVSLRQPVLNLEAVARYRQGVAQTNYGNAQFTARSQDLALRVVTAYIEAQFADEQLRLVTAQRDTYAEQKRVNERMFERGEGTKTDMLETQAKFDLAEAQVIESRDNAVVARNTLATIVGQEITALDALSNAFQVKPMQPLGFDEWKTIALKHNAEIAAQRHAVEAAHQELNRNRAGHVPRLDMVANYSKNKSETLNTFNQDSNVRSVGVQLNIPLYSGGYVTAASKQSAANFQKAKADLDAQTDKVSVELRKQHSLALSSIARIGALTKSVDSAYLLVQATEQSVKGGVRINLDLLNAQQQLYMAKRDLAQARYNYLIAYLRLRYAAGTLNADDVRTVASYFVAS